MINGKVEKIDAILSLHPSAQVVITDDVVTWVSPSAPVATDAQIEAEMVRLQRDFDASAYQRSRATEYPPIGDQLDALFHAGVFPPEMAAKIQAVKDQYPKPE